ncbi:hypothetical protein KPY62_01585 [Psychrobacter sp. TAE2020]|uniref:hypothetical protein n=1 Tax=Psychrobacter sp. TAE2020 TaxID=2846762 RepID=UPI001C0FF5E1|nr:hypothetical protein [Psychrobacter sp. TAE2020]MBU5615813.1 hypothetical protein [Psychrobacter sp. TAE2020]
MMMNKTKTSRMLEVLQTVSAQLNPLPKHSLAGHVDKQTRQWYAVFLASLLADTGTVSKLQSEYFTSLLISLDIDADVGYYLERASRLDDQQIIDLIRLLDSDSTDALLFDALVLLRIDQPLSESQGELLSAVADVFSVPENSITLASFWATKALDVDDDNFRKSVLYQKAEKLAVDKKIKLTTLESFKFTLAHQKFISKNQVIGEYSHRNEINSFGGFFYEQPKLEIFKIESTILGWLVDTKISTSEDLAQYLVIPLPKYLNNWCSFYASAYA